MIHNEKISTGDLINLIQAVKQREAPELRKMAIIELKERLQKGTIPEEFPPESRIDENPADSVRGL